MLYLIVAFAYSAANLLLAIFVYFKSRKNQISQFYGFCVTCLVTLSVLAYFMNQPLPHPLLVTMEHVAIFIYSLFPFFFLHFITMFVRRYEVLRSKHIVAAIYFVGLFAYTMILLGLIPKPVLSNGEITKSGYIFYLTWMTIFFTIGIAMLYEVARGFYDKAGKANLLFVSFVLLLLILPGPFTESVFFSVLHLGADWYYISCTFALIIAVYFIFRHKIIVHTMYDALKSALSVLNDIFMTTDEHFKIEMIRGKAVSMLLGYDENELIGKSFVELIDQKEYLVQYNKFVLQRKMKESYFDAEIICKNGDRLPMNFSFTPTFVNEEVTGFVTVGRDITERKQAEKIQEMIYRILRASESSTRLIDLFHSIHQIIQDVKPAKNFYIALHDRTKNLLTFPYFVDEHQKQAPPPRKPGRGLAEYVLRTGRSLLCDTSKFAELKQLGHVDTERMESMVWLGVPLIAEKKTIGVMVIHDYTQGKAYGKQEQFILEYVSSQVAKEIEKKRVEEGLRLFRHTMESISELVSITDTNGYFTFVNKAFLERYNYSRPEIIGKHVSTLWSPDNAAQTLLDVTNQSQSGGWRGELLNVTKDGKEFPVALSTTQILDETGSIVGLAGIAEDITEKKRTEEALRTSENKYRVLIENVPDGVYQSSPDDKLFTANPALARMLKYNSVDEILSLNLASDVYENTEDRIKARRKIETNVELRNFEVTLKCKDGQLITVLENAHLMRDRNGAIQYVEGTFTDITERKFLEDQLRQSQKMESLGTLAGGIAHDFNNILQIILVNTQSLRRGNLEPQKLSQVLEINTGAVKRGASLVQQILTFARKTDVSFESLNLNVLIDELARMLKETFPKTIVFSTELEKELPLIIADYNQIHQVLLNLCVNARDAMPEGGTICISTKKVGGNNLARQYPEARDEHYACISVTDSGHGMDELTRSRIFEPFFTTKEKGKGTGLGLAVVYGIMKTHRGFIDVKSQSGVGTTFSCFMPVSWGRAPSIEKIVETNEEYVMGKETILLVEDEDVLLESLSVLLEGNGYHVLTARDGEEAVDVYRDNHGEIALVVTDIGLPKLSGWDAFLQMKRINPHVKAIVSSGYLDPKIKEEKSNQGVSDYILKPYQPVEILKRVRGAIDGRGK